MADLIISALFRERERFQTQLIRIPAILLCWILLAKTAPVVANGTADFG